MKKATLIAGLALAAGIVGADNVLLKVTGANEATRMTGRTAIVEQADGSKVFSIENRVVSTSADFFEINPDKNYRLSVKVKVSGDDPALTYLGLAPYDAQKRYIGAHNAVAVANTLTELAAPCEPTDTVVKIKDDANWQKSGSVVVAFDAKDDDSDLPNFNTSAAIKGIEGKDGVYEVTLTREIGKAWPAGTKVRQHRLGGYVYAKHGLAPNEWTLWEGTLRGNQLRGGTLARLVFLCNWRQPQDEGKVTLFDELTIEEIE